MKSFERDNKYMSIYLLIGHVILAVLSVKLSYFSTIWGITTFIYAFYNIFQTRNRDFQAIKWVAYIAGLEVLFKVTNAGIGYESVKYFAIVFIVFGELLNPGKNKNKIWILFLFLLIPSAFFTDWSIPDIFKQVRSVISGIILLSISAYHLTGRNINFVNYAKVLRSIILPLLSLTIVVTLKTPDFEDINFSSSSNFATTGGFGPVHLTTVLGAGIIILFISYFLKLKLFYFKWIDLLILSFMLIRTLLSFSRSGLYASIITLILMLILNYNNKVVVANKRKLIISLVLFVFLFFISYTFVNDVSGGMAHYRFTGKNSSGEQMNDISSNRSVLLNEEIDMFINNPFSGIGLAMTKECRYIEYGNAVSSHTEYSRLLAEHGLIGILLVSIILFVPFRYLKTRYGISKMFFTLFILYSLLIMLPAATRTTLPMFLYGLAFVSIRSRKVL